MSPKSWQERVAVHHIDGNPRNNNPANLVLVHIATSHALTDDELHEYQLRLDQKIEEARMNAIRRLEIDRQLLRHAQQELYIKRLAAAPNVVRFAEEQVKIMLNRVWHSQCKAEENFRSLA